MKVLITSGGTKILIDRVRSITNMSKGTFGSQICSAFDGIEDTSIDFLMAKGSMFPVGVNSASQYSLNVHKYETFWEYKSQLDLLLGKQPDIIILAAAVSDYEVENYVDGKIRSKGELVIKLKPLPKLISTIREKCPNSCICGFKLLVNSTETELVQAAHDSLKENNLDLVIANDLSTIKDTKNHSLYIVKLDHTNQYFRENSYLPEVVRSECVKIWEEKYNG